MIFYKGMSIPATGKRYFNVPDVMKLTLDIYSEDEIDNKDKFFDSFENSHNLTYATDPNYHHKESEGNVHYLLSLL